MARVVRGSCLMAFIGMLPPQAEDAKWRQKNRNTGSTVFYSPIPESLFPEVAR